MSFYETYKRLCREHGKSASGAAIDMGMSRGIASCWSKGVVPKIETLTKIAEYFGEDVNIFVDEPKPKREPITSQALGSLVMMPVIGSVKAGTGLMAEEVYTGEYIGIPVDAVHNNPADYRILSVVGDSMYPIFIEGIDKLIVNVNDFSLKNGCYVVAILKNGDGVIKKLHILDTGDYELQSINPMYAPIRMDQIDRIYGVVSRSERVFG